MSGKKLVLGVSSSVSIYKACELARMIMKHHISVHVVMTENATRLIQPLLFETLTGNAVYTDTFVRERRMMGHISLKENTDLFLVAPATANVIGKFAGGIADDLLSTTYLSMSCPVILAPAMNPEMWNHAATQENIARLKHRGVTIIDPVEGVVACGDYGTGKLADIETIFTAVRNAL